MKTTSAKAPKPPKPREMPYDLDVIATETAQHFIGQADDLQRAIGMLYTAKVYGWRVLYLTTSPAYIRKAEKWLNVSFKDGFPEQTEHSRKSLAFKLVQGVSNFWKAVKGETEEKIRTGVIEA